MEDEVVSESLPHENLSPVILQELETGLVHLTVSNVPVVDWLVGCCWLIIVS